jgi:hypothetical protein
MGTGNRLSCSRVQGNAGRRRAAAAPGRARPHRPHDDDRPPDRLLQDLRMTRQQALRPDPRRQQSDQLPVGDDPPQRRQRGATLQLLGSSANQGRQCSPPIREAPVLRRTKASISSGSRVTGGPSQARDCSRQEEEERCSRQERQRSLALLCFGSEQLLLALQTPGIAAKRTVVAHHPVAGHDDRDRVGPVRRSYRPGRVGSPIARAMSR